MLSELVHPGNTYKESETEEVNLYSGWKHHKH